MSLELRVQPMYEVRKSEENETGKNNAQRSGGIQEQNPFCRFN